MVTRDQITDLLGKLIGIESVTTRLPGGSGESEIASYIAGWLAAAGADVEVIDVEPGMPNVLGRLRGTGGGPTLCLSAHSDTIGYETWSRLAPRLDGDKMYGLGAADDKAGCAAAMLTLRSLAESGARPRGDLLVACVADEEGGAAGSVHFAAHHGEIDACIVLEPQAAGQLVIEHQGFGWIDITTRGVAAHGSVPDVGVDAIVHLAEVISRLHRADREIFGANPSVLNGRTVFHAGTIAGGTDYGTYPDVATVGIEVGTQPGEHLSDRVAEIEAIFAEVAGAEPGFRGEVTVRLDREPFIARGHEALQEIVTGAMTEVLGQPPKITGMNTWTSASLMQEAGVPTLLMGPAGGDYHAAGEWVSVGEVERLCAILGKVARQYLV